MKYDKYFEEDKNDNNYIVCKICSSQASRYKKSEDRSTSTILKHIRTKHPATYKEEAEDVEKAETEKRKRKNAIVVLPKGPALKQAKLDQISSKWPSDGEKSVTLDRLVLRFLVSAALPIALVDNEDFRALLNFATGGKYYLRGRKFFTTKAIPEAYEEVQNKITHQLKDQNYLSLTADGWTAKNGTHSLLGITGHWITSEFKMMNVTLGACPVVGRHTAALYESTAQSVLETLKIDTNRVHALVTDGASTMVSLSKRMQIRNTHCFAHKMQLAANNFLEKIEGWDNTYDQMRRITKHLHKSSTARENFIECLKVNDLPERLLSKATEVRWGSMYLLCERFLSGKIAVQKLLIDWKPKGKKKKPKPVITDDMWEDIELVKDTLQPLDNATKLVQHHTSAQCSVIIPYVRLLMLAYEDDDGCIYKQEMSASLENLSEYLDDENLQLSAALDPRFKLDYLKENDAISCQAQLEALVLGEMTRSKEEAPEVMTSQELRDLEEETSLIEKFRKRNAQRTVPSPDLPESEMKIAASREVQFYLSEPADLSKHSLIYWKENSAKFPTLALLARKYLSAPSTSCESERLFSAGRAILSDYRKKMHDATFESMLYLKMNLKLLASLSTASNNNIGDI